MVLGHVSFDNAGFGNSLRGSVERSVIAKELENSQSINTEVPATADSGDKPSCVYDAHNTSSYAFGPRFNCLLSARRVYYLCTVGCTMNLGSPSSRRFVVSIDTLHGERVPLLPLVFPSAEKFVAIPSGDSEFRCCLVLSLVRCTSIDLPCPRPT